MKYTRLCFDPWFFRNVHAGGMICPCCAMHDADYGDYIIDYVYGNKSISDVFNNSEVKRLKKSLLSGDLSPMCQTCALTPQKLIDTDEYKILLEKEFAKRGIDYHEKDYSEIDALYRVGVGITNRCNLRCIYCNQSVLGDSNPYFKADFPIDKLNECLNNLVKQGVRIIETGVFGEATLHEKWGSLFSRFHRENPNIELRLVTNLSRKYTDEEIDLLSEHSVLGISIDTLDEKLFSFLRVNGNLELILKNIEQIEKKYDEKGYDHNRMNISAVVCNRTWEGIERVGMYAIEHGFNFAANNIELRPNSICVRDNLLFSVEKMDIESRRKLNESFDRLKKAAEEKSVTFMSASAVHERIDTNYNSFVPQDNNPVYSAFIRKYPHGTPNMYLGVVFDMFCNQYAGIVMHNGQKIEIELEDKYEYFVVREVKVYKTGRHNPKYDQAVFPDYKKILTPGNSFAYSYGESDDSIDFILLEIIDWRLI